MPVTEPVVYNVNEWIAENEKFFLPPVCNKMLHNEGQMKAFFVGGPNQRKDYHIECGEELFYMLKGDMVLKVVEKNKHRDVPIKEGEIFLLPGRIAHSPQRSANTIGVVLERDRPEYEKDGLRYYVEQDGVPTTQSLYEEWFHCTDLGSQLAPVIKRFFASEQYKTGKPIPGTIPDKPPVKLDSERSLTDPFSLKDWITNNKSEIIEKGLKKIFQGDNQFGVFVFGRGENTDQCDVAETWIWQREGESTVTMGGKKYQLKHDDTLLIPQGHKYTFTRPEASFALLCYQDPTKAS